MSFCALQLDNRWRYLKSLQSSSTREYDEWEKRDSKIERKRFHLIAHEMMIMFYISTILHSLSYSLRKSFNVITNIKSKIPLYHEIFWWVNVISARWKSLINLSVPTPHSTIFRHEIQTQRIIYQVELMSLGRLKFLKLTDCHHSSSKPSSPHSPSEWSTLACLKSQSQRCKFERIKLKLPAIISQSMFQLQYLVWFSISSVCLRGRKSFIRSIEKHNSLWRAWWAPKNSSSKEKR